MPSGGIRLSIDLSSSAIAAVVGRQGARIPVLLGGQLVMPHGVAVDPGTGRLQLGVDVAAATTPVDHQFVGDPIELLGTAERSADGAPPIDAVELLAAVLRHVADHATSQVGEPITALTATIPPHWGPRRRGHLTNAATRAGLPAPAMVTAPAALAAYTEARRLATGDDHCLLICQADRHPVTLTVLQASPDGHQELATRSIGLTRDLDHLLAQRIVDGATTDDDPLRDAIGHAAHHQGRDTRTLLQSVRQARHVLTVQDRAPVLLPAPRKPAVITREDVTIAAQPLLEMVPDAVHGILDAADIDSEHLAGVVLREADGVPGLADRLATTTGLTPITANQPHALAEGAMALTEPDPAGPTAAGTRLPRVRLRVGDLTGAILLGACSLMLLLQAVLTADITTVEFRVVGARTSLPQLGTAGTLAMLTAIAVAHLAPTTWFAGPPTTPTSEPAAGSLIRRGYLSAAVGGAVTAALYGLATGTSVEFDYSPYLTWTLGSAIPLAACAVVIAAIAPRIPATALPTWLGLARPAATHAAIATTGIILMRAALTLTPPVDLTGMPGLIGSAGAALLGVATALTASRSRAVRTITAPGLAIGYALVFTSDTSSPLIVGYLVALTWWGVRLTAQTLRLAFPAVGSALRRLADGQNA